LTFVAGTPSIVTEVTPLRFSPTMVIGEAPEVGPEAGLIDVIVGSSKYVKPLARLAVPPGVEISTVLEPAVAAAATAVIVIGLTTVTLVAATPPIVTLDVPVRFVPVIVIGVPPAVDPEFGVTDDIVGGAM
jgi:hypothetical protein